MPGVAQVSCPDGLRPQEAFQPGFLQSAPPLRGFNGGALDCLHLGRRQEKGVLHGVDAFRFLMPLI